MPVREKGMNLEIKLSASQIPHPNNFILEELTHDASKNDVSNQIIFINFIKKQVNLELDIYIID